MPIGRRPLARVIAAVALLDLDHRRAEVGEDFRRIGRSDAVPEFDHGDVGKRRRGSHGNPGILTPSRYTPDPNPTSRLAASPHGDYGSPNPPRGHAHAGPPDPFARKFRRQPEIR